MLIGNYKCSCPNCGKVQKYYFIECGASRDAFEKNAANKYLKNTCEDCGAKLDLQDVPNLYEIEKARNGPSCPLGEGELNLSYIKRV